MKTKYFLRNFVTSILGRIISIALALIIPKLVIENYGSEVNGLVASLMTFLIYFSLLEAGIGTASVQALYSKMSRKNHDEINGILSATAKFYKRNGFIYSFCVIVLALIYPLIVKSSLDFYEVFLIVLFLTGSKISSFFLDGKYSVLLTADNKSYVATILSTFIGIIINISKIILILNGFGILVVLGVTSALSIINSFALAFYVKKRYKFIDFSVEPNYQAIAKKNDVLAFRVLGIVRGNIDVVLLTFFLDLKIVSVYALYNMVIMQVRTILDSLSHSVSASMGQLYYENLNKFKKIYDCYETYFLAIYFSFFIALYIMIIPFIKIYTANITDINYVDPLLAFLAIIIQLQTGLRFPARDLFSWVGHYDKLKKYAIIEAVANVVLSIVLVYFLGVYGVLLATSISMIYFTVISSVYVYQKILNQNVIRLVRKSIIFCALSICVVFIMSIINLQTTNFINFFINGVITFLVCSIIFGGVISLIERQSFKTLLKYINIYIQRR